VLRKLLDKVFDGYEGELLVCMAVEKDELDIVFRKTQVYESII
jgi:hypothetical protein